MRQFTCPKAVTHPSTNRARCRATALIETNALPLHQTANHCSLSATIHQAIGRSGSCLRAYNISSQTVVTNQSVRAFPRCASFMVPPLHKLHWIQSSIGGSENTSLQKHVSFSSSTFVFISCFTVAFLPTLFTVRLRN